MIVTIDGPAGAGKSSVARELARRLGFRFLNTGAMYRAVALAALRAGADWQDEAAIADLAARQQIDLVDDRVLLGGEDVTQPIHSSEVTAVVKHVADNQQVRRLLVDQQRRWGETGDVVAEGRDQGTVAFPQAECKIFLTASAAERARRRQQDLASRGEQVEFAALLAQQNRRDAEDASRPVGALQQASDAKVLDTDGLTPEQVVERLVDLVRAAQARSARV